MGQDWPVFGTLVRDQHVGRDYVRRVRFHKDVEIADAARATCPVTQGP